MGEKITRLKNKSKLLYLIGDYFAVVVVWLLAMYMRRGVPFVQDSFLFYTGHLYSAQYLTAFVLMPFCWVLLYAVTGSYRESVYEKSRVGELIKTLLQSLAGYLALFFFYYIKNRNSYLQYVNFFFSYWGLHFMIVYFVRFIQLTVVKRRIRAGKFYFNTVMLGSDGKAVKAYRELNGYYNDLGFKILGYVSLKSGESKELSALINYLGNYVHIEQIIERKNIDQIIIALENNEANRLQAIIDKLSEKDILIKIVPDNLDIIKGSVRTGNLSLSPLTSINTGVMMGWQYDVKLAVDKIGSVLAMLVLSPLIGFVALRTYFEDRGKIIYKQERIGYKGRPFTMYKFRSMCENAENGVPQLCLEDDPRITHWGKIMRRWRLDELPQFWNILKGDMSFVGPRPERKYFIDQISEHNSYYKYLLRMKPGLTSWGMVRFGYASNIDDMQERMKYDLMYVENASLLIDIRILLQTLNIVFLGKGK